MVLLFWIVLNAIKKIMTDRDKVDELPHDVTIRREAKIEIFYKHENNFYIM